MRDRSVFEHLEKRGERCVCVRETEAEREREREVQ